MHSTYRRRLSERPLGGQKLVVRLRVRRFFCDRKSCDRRTFVEQVDRLTEPHRRAGLGLKEWLTTVAAELGGRAGERLCRKLHLAAGRTRLLELLEEPPVPERAPRVLGVDEFAFRRGRRYGTILVDVETGRVVDVLPDRTSETFAAWLTAHPGAEIICRDRASAYTKAVKQAAPGALEVADRWHLLQNLSAAVEKTCHQHRSCLRKLLDDEAPTAAEDPPEPVLIDLPPLALPKTAMVERTRHRYTDIHRLLDQGWTISAIARHLSLDRKTVRRFKTTDLDILLPPPGTAAPTVCWSRSSRTSTPASPPGARAEPGCSARSLNGATEAASRSSASTSPHCGLIPASWPAPSHRAPAQDHFLDHARPRPAQRRRGRATRPGPTCLPGHRQGVRPRPRLPRAGPQPPRPSSARLDPPGRARQPRPDPQLRRVPPAGPRRGDRRPDPRLELRHRRGPRQQGENGQESHVRPGFVPAPEDPDPHPAVSERERQGQMEFPRISSIQTD
ncbi:ISL3 family transposase [Kitasatospora sp. RB6PN24]|nr:ISL3 family transposase [Kitasatospora humi]